MINFLPKSATEGARWIAVRRGVNTMTTIVLVGYLVTVAGVLGGWLFLGNRQMVVSAQAEELSSRIQQLSNVEATVFQVSERAKMILAELGGRKIVSGEVKRLENTGGVVESWEYSGGRQKVTVTGSDLARLEAFVEELKFSFGMVTVESMTRRNDASWQVIIGYE